MMVADTGAGPRPASMTAMNSSARLNASSCDVASTSTPVMRPAASTTTT